MKSVLCRLAPVLGLLLAAPASGHESRPGYLELREVSDGRYEILWKQPAVGDLVLRLSPVFPEGSTLAGAADRQLVHTLFALVSGKVEFGTRRGRRAVSVIPADVQAPAAEVS